MDELSNLIDSRIQERYRQQKSEYDGRRPEGYIPKINASDFGMCRRAVKLRLLGEKAIEPSLDALNRWEKGREVERFVKVYLLPEEILFEEKSIETEYVRGRADLGVCIGGVRILYEIKSKDRNYLKYLKSSDEQYNALKNNLYQAYFYFEALQSAYGLHKAVVLSVSEDRSWKLAFTCPQDGKFLTEYAKEKNALIEVFNSVLIPAPIYSWQCYSRKYLQARCPYILYCLEGLKITLNGSEVIEE